MTPSILPFSRVYGAEGLAYVSGVVGRDGATGVLARDDLAQQTRTALRTVERRLREAGLELCDVVKVTLFVTNMAFQAEIDEAYREFTGMVDAASTWVEVPRLPDPEAQVEIEVVAHERRAG